MTKTAVTGFLAFQLVVGGWSVAAAQPAPKPVELYASEFHEFRTNDGTLYDVYISFPVEYAPGGDFEYPVFYVTDAFAAFAMIAQTARAFEMGRDIPPMMLVGVDNPVSSRCGVDCEAGLVSDPHTRHQSRGEVRASHWARGSDWRGRCIPGSPRRDITGSCV